MPPALSCVYVYLEGWVRFHIYISEYKKAVPPDFGAQISEDRDMGPPATPCDPAPAAQILFMEN